MKCWVLSRDCSIGLGWGILDLLRDKLAPVDGDKSGSWYIPSDSMWSGSIQEVSREIKGNLKDFKTDNIVDNHSSSLTPEVFD